MEEQTSLKLAFESVKVAEASTNHSKEVGTNLPVKYELVGDRDTYLEEILTNEREAYLKNDEMHTVSDLQKSSLPMDSVVIKKTDTDDDKIGISRQLVGFCGGDTKLLQKNELARIKNEDCCDDASALLTDSERVVDTTITKPLHRSSKEILIGEPTAHPWSETGAKNIASDFTKTNLMTDVVVKIETEDDDENGEEDEKEITRQLVGYFGNDRADEDRKVLHQVKQDDESATIENENWYDDPTTVPEDCGQVVNVADDKPPHESQTPSVKNEKTRLLVGYFCNNGADEDRSITFETKQENESASIKSENCSDDPIAVESQTANIKNEDHSDDPIAVESQTANIKNEDHSHDPIAVESQTANIKNEDHSHDPIAVESQTANIKNEDHSDDPIAVESQTANIKNEDHSDDPTLVLTDCKQLVAATNEKPQCGLQTKSGMYYDSNGIRLIDISVRLEDLFPPDQRKLGKAHSNTRSCLCIYCRGEYTYTGDSQHCLKNTENENQSKCFQTFDDKRNLPEHQKGSGLKIQPNAENQEGSFKSKKCSAECKDIDASNSHKRSYNKRKSFKCKLCIEQFPLRSSLSSHYLAVHNVDKPFKCVQCFETFWYRSKLAEHLRVHSDERPFKCAQCAAKFKFKGDLSKHLSMHRGEKPFECTQCPAKFARQRDLSDHLRVHSGERPFQCTQCSANFSTKQTLREHLKTHSDERAFKCNQCPATFKRGYTMKIHLRVHSGEKPFECQTCFAKFSQGSILKTHLAVHSGERPFKCTQCRANFKTKHTLRMHLTGHSDERAFKCEKCPATFRRGSTMKDHLRAHSGERPFKCLICPAKFTIKTTLTAHIRRHRGIKPYECKQCPAKFTRKSGLNVHLRGKCLMTCAHCSARFKLKSRLIDHLKTNHSS